TRDTYSALVKDNITFAEMSVSLNKIQTVFKPEAMEAARAEMKAKFGKDVDVRFLAMVHTTKFTMEPKIDPAKGDKSIEDARRREMEEFVKGTLEPLQEALKRTDIIGIDIAGPEAEMFSDFGMTRFKELFHTVEKAAAFSRTPKVLRPHVGE